MEILGQIFDSDYALGFLYATTYALYSTMNFKISYLSYIINIYAKTLSRTKKNIKKNYQFLFAFIYI